MIKTIYPGPLWDFCIVTESENMSKMSREGKNPGFGLLNSDSVYIIKYTDFKIYD